MGCGAAKSALQAKEYIRYLEVCLKLIIYQNINRIAKFYGH